MKQENETVTIPKDDYDFMITCLKYFKDKAETKDVSQDIDLTGFREMMGMPIEEDTCKIEGLPNLNDLDLNNS